MLGCFFYILSLWISYIIVNPRSFTGFLGVLVVSVVVDFVVIFVMSLIGVVASKTK